MLQAWSDDESAMRNCPTCKAPVDGLFCRQCEAPRQSPPRTPPPMGFDGLRAAIKSLKPRERDLEAELEREAIQSESSW